MSFFGGDEKISVIAELRAKTGSEMVVRAALISLVAPSRKENGCKEYFLHEDTKDPHNFYTYEEWSNEAALNAHLEGAAAALEQLKPLIVGEIKLTVLKKLG